MSKYKISVSETKKEYENIIYPTIIIDSEKLK
jgi:hypothetical protein